MNSVQPKAPGLPAMSADDVARVEGLESFLLGLEQVAIETRHHFHAGLYTRTICIPAGVVITGALIRIPTLLIVSGHALVHIGGESLELHGYHVLQGAAGRKQVIRAFTDTHLTMAFATQATTVEEAEAEFTEEAHKLGTRRHPGNSTTIKGD